MNAAWTKNKNIKKGTGTLLHGLVQVIFKEEKMFSKFLVFSFMRYCFEKFERHHISLFSKVEDLNSTKYILSLYFL